MRGYRASTHEAAGARGWGGVAAALAGCIGGGGGGHPAYATWLGPEMADVQWRFERERDIGFVNAARTASPATLEGSPIQRELRRSWIKMYGAVSTRSADIATEKTEVERVVFDPALTFQIVRGGVDGAAVRDALAAAGATRHGEHRGGTVFTSEVRARTENRDTVWEGVGVSDSGVAVAFAAPDADTAASFVRALVDTGAGEAPRFVNTDDRVKRTTDLLGGGFYEHVSNFGTEAPSGVVLALDGDAIRRRAVIYGRPGLADYYRERVRNKRVVYDGSIQPFVKRYTDYGVRTTENAVVFEGSVPASKVTMADSQRLV